MRSSHLNHRCKVVIVLEILQPEETLQLALDKVRTVRKDGVDSFNRVNEIGRTFCVSSGSDHFHVLPVLEGCMRDA